MPIMVLEEARDFARKTKTKISDYIRLAISEKNQNMREGKRA